MLYHYLNWQHLIVVDASSPLARIATYGVSLFFIISGFSLTLTYKDKFKNITLGIFSNYLFKRFIRIYPLFWLILILYLGALSFGGREMPSLLEVLSNVTITFSLFNEYKGGLSVGSWSIGLEIIFYLLLPFCLYMTGKYFKLSLFVLALIIVLSIYFSAYHMYEDMDNYWQERLHIINHLYFFIFGIISSLIYNLYSFLSISRNILLLGILLMVGVLIFYPIYGSTLYCVYQENLIIFTITIFNIFILIVLLNKDVRSGIIMNTLGFLGDRSYTMYLLHPIVYLFSKNMLFSVIEIHSVFLKTIIMISISIVCSDLIYRFYEIPIKNYFRS